MRACLHSRPVRLLVPMLALWVLATTVGLGTHVPADVTGLWDGSGEHQPWHRHVIDDGVAARMPGLEQCVICFLKGDPEALTADLTGALPIDDSSAALQLHSGDLARLTAPPGLAPRAPPAR